MNEREAVFAAALLGTGRAALRLPDSMAEPLAGLLREAVATHDPEGALLQAVALTRLYEQAGTVPPTLVLAVAPLCPAETGRQLPAEAAAILPELLTSDREALLIEYLTLAAVQRFVAAPALLPTILDHGAKTAGVRTLLAAIAGERGRWLAAQNPAWTWLPERSATESDSDWDTAPAAARLAMLTRWRKRDAVGAREKAAAEWKQCSAEERAGLLGALKEGLSSLDEPLLELALDDRSVGVRRAAEKLLLQLPGSALLKRLAALLLPRVTVEKRGLLRKSVLDVQLLEQCDATLERDGIERAAPAKTNGGERTHWTRQVLARIPPSRWVEQLRRKPEELIGAALSGDWAELLLSGWAEATVRFADLSWAQALWRALPLIAAQNAALLQLLPESEQEELVRQLLGRMRDHGPAVPLNALLASRFTWSGSFTAFLLSTLESYSAQSPTDHWAYAQVWPQVLKTHITRMPLEMMLPTPEASEIRQQVGRLLQVRSRYHAALQNEGTTTTL